MRLSALVVAWVLVALSGCGASEGGPGEWDGTCFDCRTVCEGVKADGLDPCLAKCVECQGYSGCFGWMEARYEGMQLLMHEWTAVDCDELNGRSR